MNNAPRANPGTLFDMTTPTISQIPLRIMDSEPRVESRVIALHLDVKHSSLYRLVTNYQGDFEEFGILRFEIEETGGRGQPPKYALLNEDQAYLLLTYSRNTARARACKRALIRAFKALREHNEAAAMMAALRTLAEDVRRLSATVTTIATDSGNFTVKAFARLNNITHLDLRSARALGHRATAICRTQGITPGRTRDEAFGYVNNYPPDVLVEAFRDLGFDVGKA